MILLTDDLRARLLANGMRPSSSSSTRWAKACGS